MRPLRLALLALSVLLTTTGWSLGQSLLRVVVLPFGSGSDAPALGLGLAAGIQRGLNGIDGLFAAPVGDPFLLGQRAAERGLDPEEVLLDLFSADVLVSGRTDIGGDRLRATIRLTGPALAAPADVTVSASLDDPGDLIASAAQAILDQVGRALSSSDRSDLLRVAQQTPGLTALAQAALASSRLPGVTAESLATATSLAPNSSWVLAEYARALALGGDMERGAEVAAQAVDLLPTDVEAWVVRGAVLLAAGNRLGAATAYGQALQLNPEHALALAGLAAAGEPAQAGDRLARALEAHPRLTEAHLQLAALQTSPQRTLQVLRRAANRVPDSTSIHRAFVVSALQSGDAAGSLAYLEQQAELPLAASPSLYALATTLPTSLGQEVLGFIREGRERFPDSTSLLVAEADMLERLGLLEESLTLLAPLLEERPTDPDITNRLGVVLAKLGETDAALALLGAAAAQEEGARLNLARVLLDEGRARSALDVLEPLATDAAGSDTLTLYGIALGRTGRFEEALMSLARALELQPDNALAAQALELLEQQLQLTRDQGVSLGGEAAVAFEQGLAALERREFGAAALAFQQARSVTDEPLLSFYEAYALQQSGRTREALDGYLRALEALPGNDVVLNNLGFAYLQLGRMDLALEHLRAAEQANPDNPRVHLNLGLTYYGLSRFQAALEAWERAFAIDPRLERAIQRFVDDARQRTAD